MKTHPVDRIKALLKTRSQSQVAAELGIHKSMVSMLVSGKRQAGDKVLKALGLRIEYRQVK